tara:strand:+ start:74 stop:622 length:549 start_codon:yes stop_codon:yes gene_type:complete
MIFSLFRSKKQNWINRLNKLLDAQLKIASDGLTSSDREADRAAFADALDRMVGLIEDYDYLLSEVAAAYVKFDIKTAKPIHKIGLKNPEKLSDEDKFRFFDEMMLIMSNLSKLSPQMYALRQTGALGFLFISTGMVCFPEVRKKGFKLWSYIEECLPMCKEFKYKKHLSKELVKLLDKEVFN